MYKISSIWTKKLYLETKIKIKKTFFGFFYLLFDVNKYEIFPNLSSVQMKALTILNPHMHDIFLQRYCMRWVPGDPLKEMIN